MSGNQTIQWARRIAALAQTGLTYTHDPYEQERCEELQQIAAEMMASSSDITQTHWETIFKNESGYATPKVDVRGAVIEDGKVLLSREQQDGRWSLPGGWADVNDTPSEAIVREVREETGYPVKCVKLAAVLDRDLHLNDPEHAHPFHIYKLLFLCERTGEADELCHDITDAAFFDVENLPPLSEHRTLPKHIKLLLQHHLTPELPTQFD
ncbi:NUDIX hydrolase [Tichowtungia aerotolerans]|uniref:NUDIX domain-containing protein n=1 Tax=Tichowtungia aerotolerans TaxID=2697043 RepID=A0A6P1M9Z6_9BACT|nr:NUDIX hydrolase [Tichowtungia aerotolerans]QHI69903.1 NUDIX domain-containing protein [Tichowtungia aerotolerans]